MTTSPHSPQPEFSLGFNFDRRLIEGVAAINGASAGGGKIVEVFGALTGAPISSARPTERIPQVSRRAFADQLTALADAGIAFNFLLNTDQRCGSRLATKIAEYVKDLEAAGVRRFTVGNPQIADIVRRATPDSHITMSITWGLRSEKRVLTACDAGADAAYLDGVYVNRDFRLLRRLLRKSPIECRLYANVSCISRCPVVRQHYRLFAGCQGPDANRLCDAYFAGCSLVKLRSPVEWIQTPWIRPEDVGAYVEEGVSFFKLSDRLAPTDVLLNIASSYLHGASPRNLFDIIERNGVKYQRMVGTSAPPTSPLTVDNAAIPGDFIDHFRSGECSSFDLSCTTCREVAASSVRVGEGWDTTEPDDRVVDDIPAVLMERVAG